MKKNNTPELLKLFASYMVVFVHVIFSGYIGVAAETLARFAVPFFFLISGFYSYLGLPIKIKIFNVKNDYNDFALHTELPMFLRGV